MQFRVLGPLEVIDDGRVVVVRGDRQRALLAFFLINAGQALSTDRISEALWGDKPPTRSAKALSFHVAKLRAALEPGKPTRPGDDLLATVAGGYVLRADPEQIDARRCERLAAEGHRLLPTDPGTAADRFEEALALWRGAPLDGVGDEGFARAEVARLEELRLRLVEDHFEAQLALGRHADAIAGLELAVARDPLREQLRGQLILALYRSGRQAEALRVYDDGRRVLAEDLGIDPSPALQQLLVAVLNQDPKLELHRAAASPRNPYKGLRAFDEPDRADFFGRETLVRRLVERLADVARGGRLLTLVGPSGSGKSSVVRAGLVPAVRDGALPGSDRWPIAMMYPGSRPFSELAAALSAVAGDRWRAPGADLRGSDLVAAARAIAAASDGRLLLVIDQFEELLQPGLDEATRTAFVRCVVTALAVRDSPLLVVTTLRADHLDRLLLWPELGSLVRDGLEVVTPLGRDDLERAIASPALAVGTEIEAGLAAEMAVELERQPAALPLLQYAMTELFERCAGRRLTRQASAAIGGVLGALGQRAEESWQALDPPDRETARQLLLRLVAFEGRSAAAVRRMPRAALGSAADEPGRIERIVDGFGRRRLLAFDRDPVTGEATVEIAHEALLSRWPRLAGWVEEERHDLWMRGRLGDAATEWVAAGRQRDYLLTGARLDLARSWASSTDLRLSEDERALLDASVAESLRGEEVERARATRERSLERRATTRLRALVVVFAVAALVATTLAGALLRQGQEAAEQAAIAAARERAAVSVAKLETDPQLSLMLAIEAADATLARGFIVDDAMYALHWALQEARVPYPATNDLALTAPGPGGVRGLFLLPPATLIRLAIEHVDRALTDTECTAYLHVAACPTSPAPPAPDRRLDVYTAAGRVPAGRLADASLAGTTVLVASELPADLQALLTPFERREGVRVTSHPLEIGDLEAMAAAGALPDVAIISRPAAIASLAGDGSLIELGYLDVAGLRSAMGDRLVDLGTVSGSGLYGLPIALSSGSRIWYPKAAFEAAGYAVPQIWPALLALSQQIVADGGTPWCLGTDEGASSGASAADWVEELVLHRAGPTVYDRWTDGERAFDSGDIARAFGDFREIAFGDGFVDRGPANITHVSPWFAALPMMQDPPGCWLDLATTAEWASWPERLRHAVGVFPFPGPNASTDAAVRGKAYMVVAFYDRPEVRRVVEELTSEGFGAAIASDAESTGLFPATTSAAPAGGALVASINAGLREALGAGTFRVDASDRMPTVVASGFRQGMLEYLSGREDLGTLLRDIDAGWFRVVE